jgi:competence protein ComEC
LVEAPLLLAPAPVRPPDRPTLTFLDVGEGAASLLQVPDGPTILVDAGPEPLARTLRRHAVGRIDLLVVSHGHDDHVAGLSDVIGSVPVRAALLPEPEDGASRSAGALDELERRLTASGTDVRRCTSPLDLGGGAWGLHVYPSRPVAGVDENQRENDDALVVVADLAGQRLLLPGDAEGQALEDLGLPACAVVAAPHHGSDGGFDAALLDELAPRLAVIPVGPNDYGHPDPDTLALFADAGIPLARTDQCGEVAVWADARGLTVAVERSPQVAAVQPRRPAAGCGEAYSSLRLNDQAASSTKITARTSVTTMGASSGASLPLSIASLAARMPAGLRSLSRGKPVSTNRAT